MADENQSPPEIKIKLEWCKGCGYCVEYCKPGAIYMKGAVPVVVDATLCTTCMLCDYMCPDFAISVTGEPIKKKKKKPAA